MQAQDMRQMLERVLNLALSYLLATMSCAENTDSLIQAVSSKPINQKIPIHSAYTEKKHTAKSLDELLYPKGHYTKYY